MKLLVASLAAAGLVCVSQAAPKKEVLALPTTVPGSETILLNVETVQKDIGLNSLQRTLLNSLRKQYREEARKVVASAGESADMKITAQQKLDALMDSYDKRALRVLNTTQRQRLVEIEHQVLGGYMLLSPDLQQELALTAKQKEQLAAIWDKGQKYVSKVNGWYEKGEVSHNEKLIYLYDDRLERSEDMLDVLTDAQLEKFEHLAGEKFLG